MGGEGKAASGLWGEGGLRECGLRAKKNRAEGKHGLEGAAKASGAVGRPHALALAFARVSGIMLRNKTAPAVATPAKT